jgi:hypothetical protein
MTPKEFKERNRFDEFERGWTIANPNSAVDCGPHFGPWKEYFDRNLKCGWFPTRTGLGGCGLQDWELLPNGIWVPEGGHTLRCTGCNRVTEVVVVAEAA